MKPKEKTKCGKKRLKPNAGKKRLTPRYIGFAQIGSSEKMSIQQLK